MTNTTNTPSTLYAVVILDGDNFGEFIQHGGIFTSFDEADREGRNLIQEIGDNDPMVPINYYYEVVRTQIDGTAEVVETTTTQTYYAEIVSLDGLDEVHGMTFAYRSYDEALKAGEALLEEHHGMHVRPTRCRVEVKQNLLVEEIVVAETVDAEAVEVEPTTQHPAYPADFPAPLTLCKALRALAVVVEDVEGENAYSKLLDTLADARLEIEGWFTDHLASNAPLFIDSVIAEAK